MKLPKAYVTHSLEGSETVDHHQALVPAIDLPRIHPITPIAPTSELWWLRSTLPLMCDDWQLDW